MVRFVSNIQAKWTISRDLSKWGCNAEGISLVEGASEGVASWVQFAEIWVIILEISIDLWVKTHLTWVEIVESRCCAFISWPFLEKMAISFEIFNKKLTRIDQNWTWQVNDEISLWNDQINAWYLPRRMSRRWQLNWTLNILTIERLNIWTD